MPYSNWEPYTEFIFIYYHNIMKICLNFLRQDFYFHSTQKNSIFKNPVFSLECWQCSYIGHAKDTRDSLYNTKNYRKKWRLKLPCNKECLSTHSFLAPGSFMPSLNLKTILKT